MKVPSLSLTHPWVTVDKAPPCDVHFLETTLQVCTSRVNWLLNIAPGSSVFHKFLSFLPWVLKNICRMKKGMSQSRKKKLIKVGEAYVTTHLLFSYVNLTSDFTS